MRSHIHIAFISICLAVMFVSRADAADRLCDASYEDCRAPLLELISNEQIGIDVAFWFMEDSRYSAALIARWRAGVPVRVIMDTQANANYPLNADLLKQLEDAGIPMLEKVSGGIVHWKTMIFAGQNVVEFSGANFSPHAFRPNTPYVDYVDEVICFTDNPSLVNSFKRRYDDVWTATSGYRAYANITTTRTPAYPTFSVAPELNFPPFNNFATRSVGRYNAETVAVDAMMYRITDRRHTDALIAAIGRGVPVRLITEPNQYRDPVRLWHSWNVDRLYMAGAKIRQRAHAGGGMHQKTTLLRGQRMTIFGSSNWTSASATSQLEHNIFTMDPFFYEFFSDEFDRKWNNRTGNIETKPFVPLPPTAPKYASPANGVTGQSLSVTLKWNAGYFAHKYDIYFGTSSNPPLVAATVELGPSKSPTDYRAFTVSGLQEGTTYYWKIVSKTMADRSAAGPVWNFRTTGTAPSAGATLPSGWQSRDIGTVGKAGSASESSGSFTVRGSGDDVWNTADEFHYAYRTLAGDGTIIARVASVSGSEAWTKVGVMIRGSTSAGSAHAFMLVSTGKGLAFQRRTSNGGLSTHTSGGTGTAPRWVRLTRAGGVITAYVSTTGTTWTKVGSDTFALPSTVLVGLAVSSHNAGVLATGVFDHVAVSP